MAPSWMDRVRADWASGEKIRWTDALAACPIDDSKYIVTSPNRPYVPTPLLGKIDVVIGPDGHFGPADPILHPQVLEDNTRYLWIAAIERQPSSKFHPRAVLWHALSQTDTEPLHADTATTLRTVKRGLLDRLARIHGEVCHRTNKVLTRHPGIQELQWLSDATQYAFDQLDFPATFRDLVRQVACFRRYALYTYAWLKWNVSIKQSYPLPHTSRLPADQLMGCITGCAIFAQDLFKYNVPVWLLRMPESFRRTEVVKSVVLFQLPMRHLNMRDDDLRLLEAELSGRFSCSLQVGNPHLDWIARQSSFYFDVERRPYPAEIPCSALPNNQGTSTVHVAQSSSTGITRTQKKSQDARYKPYPAENRSYVLSPPDKAKFAPCSHPGLADAIPAWQTALSSVDTSVRKVPEEKTWPYWVPEPRLVIGPTKADCQRRFVHNWLRVREPWYSLLHCTPMNGNVVGPLKATQWREYLGTSPTMQEHLQHGTKRAQRNQEVAAVFMAVFKGDILDASIPAKWFKKDVKDLVDSEWNQLCREVTWELSEVGFRYELGELDCYLVRSSTDPIVEQGRLLHIARVFPGSHGLLFKQFPTVSDGLGARSVQQRSRYLEALRVLVSRWPEVPDAIKNLNFFISSTLLLEEQEAQLLTFYCQTFFDVSGRAPIIPRRVPRSQ